MTQISILPSGNMLRNFVKSWYFIGRKLMCRINKHHLHYDSKTGLSSRKEDKKMKTPELDLIEEAWIRIKR